MSGTKSKSQPVPDTESHKKLFLGLTSIRLTSWKITDIGFFLAAAFGIVFNAIDSSSNFQYKFYTFFPFLMLILTALLVLIQHNLQLFAFQIDSPHEFVQSVMLSFKSKRYRWRDFIIGLAYILTALVFLLTYTGLAYMHPLYIFIGLMINSLLSYGTRTSPLTESDKKSK